jgi:23S rRNA (adenine2030-N6)-methyltransferase
MAMNYRHAFHAGNFADVVKHVILVRVLMHLRSKDKPFRVIDTHAGIGFYNLAGEEAERTQEWESGVGRLQAPFDADTERLIAAYRAVLEAVRGRHGPSVYPGSPLITRELLRRQDRAVLAELHAADNALLAERFNTVANMKVLHIDGWTALHALIPPKERRGLVLIDPPYEEKGELDRLGAELGRAVAKWPTGVYMAWYPIKDGAQIDRVAADLERVVPRPGLRLEVHVERPDDPARLNGSGLFVINPPWLLEGEARQILPALAERLARNDYGAYRCDWLRENAEA